MSEAAAETLERSQGVDARLSAERRRRSAQIRQARERLTTSDVDTSGCEIQLLRLYARSRRTSAIAAVAMIALAGSFACSWVAWNVVAFWSVGALASLALCYALAQDLAGVPDAMVVEAVWRRRFIAAEFLHGLMWAAMAAILIMARDDSGKIVAFGALLNAAAFNTMASAPLPPAVAAALAPIFCASLLLVATKSAGTASLALLYMNVAAQLFFFILARRFHRLAAEGLAFRAEKSALIVELEQAKANSDEARRRAEEANFAKSRFLATMSHELRTPLNAILGFSEVLMAELFGPHANPVYKDYSRDIHASGQHLLALINEILDLSRVEAGRYELREESVSLAGVAQECRHLLAIRAQKRGIRIVEAMESDLPRLWADERAVRQIVLNLLTNAVKFTPQGGQVTIKIGWTQAGGQYVAIKDTGPGIPQDEIDLVMSAFGRGALAQKNADEGAGLGLPIVKGLVDLHGGRFVLKAQLRQGTEAIVVFPPARVMSAPPRVEPLEQARSLVVASIDARRRSAA